MTSPVIIVSVDGLAAFYWTDPRARMPNLRRLAAAGAFAARMETVFPSMTWPSHASIVTGVRPHRHGVVANSILNRATGRAEDLTGDPVYDAGALFRTPTLYDLARAAGRETAAVDWPATRRAASLGFNLPFLKDQAVFREHTTPAVWDELVALGYPVERMGEWAELPRRFFKDAMVADLAAHVRRRYAPDLLLVHFLATDSFQHLWGPRAPEVYWAIEYVDERIGRLLASLGEGEVPDRTTVVVVSDHGFLPVEREVRPNVRLAELGLLDGSDGARFVANGGGGFLYALRERDRRGLARSLALELAKLEGVAHVWSDAHGDLGLPTPDADDRVGDLVLESAPGYMFVNDVDGEAAGPTRRYRGAHGHRPLHADNGAFFLAAGPGIRRGLQLDTIRSVDVAPTVARMLGLRMEGVEGRTLDEMFI